MTRIKVGPVDIRTDMDLTPKQVRALLNHAASVALALGRTETEAEPAPLIGFTAPVLERLPDDLADMTYPDD